jgi:hypothetical protein
MAAGDAVYVGSTDWSVVVDYKHSYAFGQGWRHVYTYEGPESGRVARELVLVAAGAVNVDGQAGTPARIVASFPDDANETNAPTQALDTESEWSLTSSDLGKELGTHGKFNPSASSPTVLAKIDEALRKGVADLTDWDASYGATGNYNAYMKLRGMGVKEWETEYFLLRRTVVVERGGTAEQLIAAQLENPSGVSIVGKIISWTDIGVPSFARIPQPYIHIYVGNGQGTPPGITGAIPGWFDVKIGQWKVQSPQLTFQSVGRVKKRRIEFAWKGAVQYSSTLYDGGTATP